MKSWKNHTEIYAKVITDLVNVDYQSVFFVTSPVSIQICFPLPKRCNEPNAMLRASV